jgi:hypothetical protein
MRGRRKSSGLPVRRIKQMGKEYGGREGVRS